MKKLVICTVWLFCLTLAATAQPNKLKEYKITIKGSAPLVLVDGKRRANIIAVYTDKNGKDFATAILQDVAAAKATADKNGNSTVTILLSSTDIAGFEAFKKENPLAVFTLTIRSVGDRKIFPAEKVSYDIMFGI
jgi:hypothetical protein